MNSSHAKVKSSLNASWFTTGRFLPWLVLIFSLTITYHLYQIERDANVLRLQQNFDFHVRESSADIKQRLLTYEQVLRGAEGLFSASESVTRNEFRTYIEHQHLKEDYPGIQGVGYSLIVPPAQKDRHIAEIRRELPGSDAPLYRIKPEGVRSLYTSIIYLEPFSGRNLRAFGYDMYSEPVRRAAMDKARDTGNACISGKVRLVQETENDVQAGFLMYLPVYKNGMPHDTVTERRANIIGWAYEAFRMNDLINGIHNERANELDYEIFDGETVSKKTLMFDSDNLFNSTKNARFQTSVRVDIAGHIWTLLIGAYPALEARVDTRRASLIIEGGIAVSLLLTLLSWLLLAGRRRALALAQAMTQELTHKEQILKHENEKNLAFLHNASDGIYILDDKGNTIEVSDSFCAMLGYRRNEMIGMNVSQWCAELSGDELTHSIGQLLTRQQRTQFESIHRRRDGSILNVEISSSPLELEGKLVLFNSARDITERKKVQNLILENEQRLLDILNVSPIAVRIAVDRGHRVVFYNKSYAKLIKNPEAMNDDPGRYYAQPEDYEAILKTLAQGGTIIDRQVELNIPGEAIIWSLASYMPMRYQGEDAILGWFYDITERKQAEEELRIAATAFETDECIMITDKNNRIVRVNRAFTRLTGYSAAEAIGKNPNLLKSDRQDAAFYAGMWAQLSRDKYWRGEIWNRRKNGEIHPEWMTITGVTDTEGNLTHYVAVSSDITQRKLDEERIRFLAYHDKMTGLPNRTLFYDRLSRAMSQARRNHSRFALLFLDLDGFKSVNDIYGHQAGDDVLKATAMRILSCVRDVDTVARLGGDEFAIILGEIEQLTDITAVAEKISPILMEDVLLHDNQKCSVGVSIGIAIYPDDGAEIDSLMNAADDAMYVSKSAGKRGYTFSSRHVSADTDSQPWIMLENSYWLGIPEIDREHMKLIELLNKLNTMVKDNESAQNLERAFNEYIETTRSHFENEERLMELAGYDIDMHKHEHQRMLAEAVDLKKKFFNGGESMVLQSLKSWFLNHLLHSDREFADFLVKRQDKAI